MGVITFPTSFRRKFERTPNNGRSSAEPAASMDPDNVPETLCDGQFNISVLGQLATMTFTHVRPDAENMFGTGVMNTKSVVRARIVLTLRNLEALRDLLNRIIQTPNVPAPPAGGATKH
jgi:hypothetical protein